MIFFCGRLQLECGKTSRINAPRMFTKNKRSPRIPQDEGLANRLSEREKRIYYDKLLRLCILRAIYFLVCLSHHKAHSRMWFFGSRCSGCGWPLLPQ